MERIMAVVTKEKKYSERLCGFFNRKRRLALKAVSFGSMEECSRYSNTHNIKLLLADSEMLSGGYGTESIKQHPVRTEKIFSLVRDNSYSMMLADSGMPAGCIPINKYQSAEMIMRDLVERCDDIDIVRAEETAGRYVRIIGIYSPAGSCLKGTFAVTLCRMIGRNRRVLYMNLEEFSGFSHMTGEDYVSSISDALYHLKQGTLDARKLQGMIYSAAGIDFIPPIRQANDRSAIDGDDYVRLVSAIINNTSYDTVVINMDRFSGEAADLFEICGTIYVPVTDDYPERMKTEEFIEYLGNSGHDELVAKIETVHLPETGTAGNSRDYQTYIDSLMYGPMGDMILRLKEA